ncbi:MAG TPA: inositol monophosphatase family protein [Chloroflexota bacterium]
MIEADEQNVALEAAIDAARAAGVLLRAHLGKVQSIRHKGEVNLVTEVDEASEAEIVARLRARFPNDQILAEEGTTGGDDPARRWLVDPLDGTTNYAHGYPVFCVSIALEMNGSPEVGVIYQPVLDELFTAVKGRGAFLNGQPIRVSATSDLVRSLLVTGFPYDRQEARAGLALFGRFVLSAQAVRRDGSAALDLAYIAHGRFDGFWEVSLGPWDVAAGGLLVSEAGGRLSDFDGGPVHSKQIVASNGLIHEALLATIRADSAVSG